MAYLVEKSLQQTQTIPNDRERRLITGLQSAASAVRSAAEADKILFKKARVFMKCRPQIKQVLFNISHQLYQSGNLEEDVKQLKCDHYEGAVPPASLIWGERFDQDVLQSSKSLNEDNFWTFVHSVAWRKFSSIRVTHGALLDSLLYSYYSLVQDGKLYSFTTEVFQKNDPTVHQRMADKKNDGAPMKITFTYYAPSLQALSEIIYHHQGSKVSLETLAQQNESPEKQPPASPNGSLDFAWSAEPKESNASIIHATPINPPNSPTPSRSPTEMMLKKRKDESLLGGLRNPIVKYPSSYYSLPLVLRNRFTLGLKQKGDDGMAIEGKHLQCHQEDNGQYSPCSQVYFTRESNRTQGYKSSLQAVRASYCPQSQSVRLPSLTPSPTRKDAEKSTPETRRKSSSPLHSCLATPNHRTKDKERNSPDQESPTSMRPDSKRTLTFSPNLEYINVVRRVTPEPISPTKPQGNATFDTSKLYINWSLDKMRRERRIGKYRRKTGPSQKALFKKLQKQETDKDYVLGKFLADHPLKVTRADGEGNDNCPLHVEQEDIQCEKCLRHGSQEPRPLTIITNHSNIRKLRFSSVGSEKQAGVSSAIPRPSGYADTVEEFRNGCYRSTKQFIIRKEQVTTSEPFVTVTSLTINKIPREGFETWQYATADAMLDK
ncbi:uncharacterized protein LOC121422617 [Lytechinus variegatus]|uniref:uncharacterized protein LOC121422617 n=1 Tax=Lytechinus variegatus TaxID=7654 RepID=UPI001BB1781B|nr:uncharacterized protein LOC121422617 [Lytechinus variegatus]